MIHPGPKHLAVIMARGESRRMGHPKGLCRLEEDGPCFVESIIRSYQVLEIPVLLVVLQEHEADYRACLGDCRVSFLSAPGGNDTAQTLALALAWALENDLGSACLWAHPVDLPLVRGPSLAALKTAFNKAPDQAWRPWHNNTPGHPVLIPGDILSRVLNEVEPSGTMSQVWLEAVAGGLVEPFKKLEINDPGVVTDFDRPGQLGQGQKQKESPS